MTAAGMDFKYKLLTTTEKETINVATTTAEKEQLIFILALPEREQRNALPRLLLNLIYYNWERERESTAT